ncbi:hypothetical protein NC653_014519 [Populus alba x Populus x berolinensis]|uniref:Uncharacterized protein n=1 Tax=Populus alba x Populus x berolinensis TaxID=444605 RepID=A0AAD6QX57_9ROSI|nr:hypothetical protein NC653_014519 [Populus alba x Populus x berolinensis]
MPCQFRSRATKGLRVHVKAGFADLPTSLSLSLSHTRPLSISNLRLYITPFSLFPPRKEKTKPPPLSFSSFRSLYPSLLSIIYKAKENIYCDTLEAF